ncbi:MAG: MBL fold metallo-hydrolase [Deltaproteobacteria bacterium]|nr:MAG: MBL fold metallo-hydrolase [Deltaproteobacteria bacterium]
MIPRPHCYRPSARPFRRATAILCLLVFTLWVSPRGYTATLLNISFIDVGEGDAIFLEVPGHCNFLVDTGNPVSGVKVLSFLVQRGTTHLDHLILTHPHLDHIGGAFSLIQLLHVEKVYDNGEDLTSEVKTRDLYRWYQSLVRSRSRYSTLKVGQTLRCPPLTVKVLWPPRPGVTRDWNTNSLVLRVSFGAFHCLLMGDANITAEKRLLAFHAPLRAQILKAGHHGANDATSPELLSAVSPEVVIISVNKDNIRGYPSAQTLKRIQKTRAKILRTDQNGTITIRARLDGTYQIFPERP